MNKARIEKILEKLNEDIYEKDEIIAVALLGALAGLNTFLLGPPGTAKSLLARRISSVFESSHYFEFLMNKFSTPEEVFGPIKISQLKQDNYERKIDGYLPSANVAFLDEIWKANSAILNSLLTIINEKKFRNGDEILDVPLKVLISASNEVPQANQGLDALYDRFLIRLNVLPTEDSENFNLVIQNTPANSTIKISDNEKITNDELDMWQLKIDEVKLSDETINIIKQIRMDIAKYNKKNKNPEIYISDRRWQKAARLLKASAFFCDRKETNLVDTLLLRHCLWSDLNNRKQLETMVEESVRNNGFETGISFSILEKKSNDLDNEIQEEFFHSKDIYDFDEIDGKKHSKHQVKYDANHYSGYYREADNEQKTFYVSVDKSTTDEDFHPTDKHGKDLEKIVCNFQGQSNIFSVQVENAGIYQPDRKSNDRFVKSANFKFNILSNKGSVKQGVNPRLFNELEKDNSNLLAEIKQTQAEIEERKSILEKQIESPFVPQEIREIAIASIDKQLMRISGVEFRYLSSDAKISTAKRAQ